MTAALLKIALIVIVTFVLRSRFVSGTGRIGIRFLYYSNPNGLDTFGNACDPVGPCDPLFTITVSTADNSVVFKAVTDRAQDKNSIAFADKIVNINNPIIVNINTYTGRFTVQVKVDDYDPIGSWDYIGTFSYTGLDKSVTNDATPNLNQFELRDDGLSGAKLGLQTYVACDLHYYGTDCASFCSPADDDLLGHFSCDPSTGSRVCLPTYNSASGCRQTNCAYLNPCQNSGICGNTDAGFACNCVGLWGGPTCSQPVSACQTPGSPCRHNATCLTGTGGSGCLCQPGFSGPDCSKDVDECAMTPPVCQHAASCENQPGTYSCRCTAGWRGKTCSEDVDECEPSLSTCYNGGTCVNLQGSFACACPTGFTGQRCQADVDECDTATGGHNFNACRPVVEVCQNLQGGFICLCSPGWSGVNCSVRYVTEAEAQAAASSQTDRVVAAVLTPTLLLLAAACAAAATVSVLCWRKRRLQQQQQQQQGSVEAGYGGEGVWIRRNLASGSSVTENATYSTQVTSTARHSSAYEDPDGQYTRIHSLALDSPPVSGPLAEIQAPPLPPKRQVGSENKTKDEDRVSVKKRSHRLHSEQYSLMSEAVTGTSAAQQLETALSEPQYDKYDKYSNQPGNTAERVTRIRTMRNGTQV